MSSAAAALGAASGAFGREDNTSAAKKIAVVYYSRTGENYAPGTGTAVIETGHTARFAKFIADKTGAALFEIEPATPYPAKYRETTEVVKKELESGKVVAMQGTAPNLSAFDTVFIGHPIWWGRMPPAFTTFLKSVDLAGKTVAHFCTHEGSGFGQTEGDLKALQPKAEYLESLAVQGSRVAGSQKTIDAWIDRLGI